MLLIQTTGIAHLATSASSHSSRTGGFALPAHTLLVKLSQRSGHVSRALTRRPASFVKTLLSMPTMATGRPEVSISLSLSVLVQQLVTARPSSSAQQARPLTTLHRPVWIALLVSCATLYLALNYPAMKVPMPLEPKLSPARRVRKTLISKLRPRHALVCRVTRLDTSLFMPSSTQKSVHMAPTLTQLPSLMTMPLTANLLPMANTVVVHALAQAILTGSHAPLATGAQALTIRLVLFTSTLVHLVTRQSLQAPILVKLS